MIAQSLFSPSPASAATRAASRLANAMARLALNANANSTTDMTSRMKSGKTSANSTSDWPRLGGARRTGPPAGRCPPARARLGPGGDERAAPAGRGFVVGHGVGLDGRPAVTEFMSRGWTLGAVFQPTLRATLQIRVMGRGRTTGSRCGDRPSQRNGRPSVTDGRGEARGRRGAPDPLRQDEVDRVAPDVDLPGRGVVAAVDGVLDLPPAGASVRPAASVRPRRSRPGAGSRS